MNINLLNKYLSIPSIPAGATIGSTIAAITAISTRSIICCAIPPISTRAIINM
ncbi:hypothetical protein YpUG050454_1884 [Yersinia pestis biovar Antiqua str. UG05-0454]|nr:hypothetical protein YpUG050454_1884 [Yersinia pestis biovar Antiqua str. UG05-0454]